MMLGVLAVPCRGGKLRSAAPRGARATVALALLACLVSSGCAASRSRHYRAHLTSTVASSEPDSVDRELAATFGLLEEDGTAIAAADDEAAWSGDR